jgi:hypothetical protein
MEYRTFHAASGDRTRDHGLPLVSYRTITELISATTTANGLTIRAEEDLNHYETGTKVRAARLNTACRRRPRQLTGRADR